MSQQVDPPSFVEQVFGVPANDPGLIAAIRRGATPARAARLRDTMGVEKQQFAAWLGVHPRTMQRAEEDGKPLSPGPSDRLYRLCAFLDHGVQRLGSAEALREALRQPVRGEADVTRADLLDTTPGMERVRRGL